MPSSGRDLITRLTGIVREHERERKTTSLPRYAPVSEIGRGGMGVVMKAWDRVLSRYVALKYVSVPEDVDALARFESEARLAASLNHGNITAIHDFGDAATEAERAKGQVKPFLVMQLIEGRTLETEPCDDFFKAARLVAQAARGVFHAHTKGVIHRDLKPGNIMVDASGRAFVMDFGLAKAASREVPISSQGYVMGTPAYMSPEQAAGRTEEVDAKSDIYSLGATLYRLVTGRPPATGTTSMEVVASVAHGTPSPVRSLRPACPKAIERAIEKAMAKRREDRYETAEQFAIDLERAARPKRRKWAVIYSLSGAVGALAVVALAAWAVFTLTDPKARNERRMQELVVEARRTDSDKRLTEIHSEMRRLAPADARTAEVEGIISRRLADKVLEARRDKCFELFRKRDTGGLRASVAELPKGEAIGELVPWLEQFEVALAAVDEAWRREIPKVLPEKWRQEAAAHMQVLAAAVEKKKEEAKSERERIEREKAEARRGFQEKVDAAGLEGLEELERTATSDWHREVIKARRLALVDAAIAGLGGAGAEKAHQELLKVKGLDPARRLRIATAMLDLAASTKDPVWLGRSEKFEAPDAAFYERRGSLRLRINQSEVGVLEDWKRARDVLASVAAPTVSQRILRAKLLRRLGSPDKALRELETIEGHAARLEAGMALLAQQEFDRAEAEFLKAGHDGDSRYWRGVALKYAGKPDEALLELEAVKGGDSLTAMLSAVRMSVKNPPAPRVIADLGPLILNGVRLTEEEFVAIGEPTMDAARRFVRLELLIVRARAYLEDLKFPQGEADCAAVIAATPRDFNALIVRGWCRLKLRQYRGARSDANEAQKEARTPEQKAEVDRLLTAIDKEQEK